MKRIIEKMSLVDAVDSCENSENAELIQVTEKLYLLRSKKCPEFAFLMDTEAICVSKRIAFKIENYGELLFNVACLAGKNFDQLLNIYRVARKNGIKNVRVIDFEAVIEDTTISWKLEVNKLSDFDFLSKC